MEKLKEREHDFSSKLRQKAILQSLKDYIRWQRARDIHGPGQEFPMAGPVSINLDLTSTCNYSCSFCVDSNLINAGKSLALEDVKKLLDTLHSHGLRSVILIGGGEPTLHKDFGEIVRYMKSKRLQVGIVTNGSRLDKIEKVVQELEEKDWIRISIDAAREGTFKELHLPKTDVSLRGVLENAKKVKEKNCVVSLGFSFVIVWEGVEINGKKLHSNIAEIVPSVELAGEFSFDYISFKPCLVRFQDSQRETLLKNVDPAREKEIFDQIMGQLEKAKRFAGDRLKVLESSNLKAVLDQETERIKRQPQRCHMQFFRTVVTPFGIFHCPAFRGVKEAKVAEKDGYLSETKFQDSLKQTAQSILTFDAEMECKDVGCFYNRTNWWLEEFIQSPKEIDQMKGIEDDNFFL